MAETIGHRKSKVFGRTEDAGFTSIVMTRKRAIAAITVFSRAPIGSNFSIKENARNRLRYFDLYVYGTIVISCRCCMPAALSIP